MRLDVPFNLDVTLCCGQVFRWKKCGVWWFGVIGDRVLKIRQTNMELEFEGNIDDAFVKSYFGLDHDLPHIRREINKDSQIRAALHEFWGLRIIRQPRWECLISFMCATYKNVAAIQQMLLRLSAKFGEKLFFEGGEFFSFPTPEKLAGASLKDLESCGLGYRAKYVLKTSKTIYDNAYDLNALRSMPYVQAKKELCQFPGVGSKVADCILLFSLDKLEAFPVDVWVKRIILKYYSQHFPDAFVKKLNAQKSFSNADYKKLNDFGRRYFGEYAGYAQEYLYHHERMTANEGS